MFYLNKNARTMNFFLVLVVFTLVENGRADVFIDNEGSNLFDIPHPKVCETSKTQIYSDLIKRSNSNLMKAYRKYMPKSCNFSAEVVKHVEAYRNAANHVVIILNREHPIDTLLSEILRLYDSQLIQLNEGIRDIAVTRNLSNACLNSLMLLRLAVVTTGEGLVEATLITYNTKCPSTRRFVPMARKRTDRPIDLVSNDLSFD